MSAPHAVERGEVQCLVHSGYTSDHALHLVLRVEDAEQARAVLRTWLGSVTFADASERTQGVNIGFTYRGLEALQIPDALLRALTTCAPAFAEGAPLRATRHLGDAGASAPSGWEPMTRNLPGWVGLMSAFKTKYAAMLETGLTLAVSRDQIRTVRSVSALWLNSMRSST